jgi:coenzyme Q-binding protein COQ10
MSGGGGFLKSFLLQPVTKRHVERQILKTPPKHLFRIIQDVDRYSEFLPLCTKSQVIRRQGNNLFDATLTVGMPPMFTENFVSRVTTDPTELVVESKSIQSKMFDQLSSRWKLKANAKNPNETEVDFWTEMTVSDPVIVSVLDQVLKEVAGRQVAAFEKRCKVIPIAEEDLGNGRQ